MDDLLQQGITAFRAGRREEARNIFVTVVKQNPENDRAWGWMYDVSSNDKERAYCLKQMLRINPNNKKATQLLNELTASKPTSSSRGVALKPAIFISIILVCIIGICTIGICTISLLFMNRDVVTSTSTIDAPIPIETIIGLTYSAARTQTAMVSSPVPVPTLTLAPPIENIPTATVFIFQLQTNVAQPTEYIYLTNTPLSLATQPLPTLQSTTPPQSAVCSCSGNTLNCGDFSTHSQAQACYNYCVSLGRGDVHALDGDKDDLACENLP